MSERRIIFIGKKPLHLYIRAVVMSMEAGDREVELVARGATIGRAVDVAEVCRRRNGWIAQGLPEEVVIGVSVLKIELDGIGDIPIKEEE
jgi:DNA-binding protein